MQIGDPNSIEGFHGVEGAAKLAFAGQSPCIAIDLLLMIHFKKIFRFELFKSLANMSGFWGFGEIGRASCRER